MKTDTAINNCQVLWNTLKDCREAWDPPLVIENNDELKMESFIQTFTLSSYINLNLPQIILNSL